MSHIKVGPFCADKVEYKDGIGCCIWYPMPDDEEVGLAWDFAYEDIDALIALLQELKTITAEVYVKDAD